MQNGRITAACSGAAVVMSVAVHRPPRRCPEERRPPCIPVGDPSPGQVERTRPPHRTVGREGITIACARSHPLATTREEEGVGRAQRQGELRFSPSPCGGEREEAEEDLHMLYKLPRARKRCCDGRFAKTPSTFCRHNPMSSSPSLLIQSVER
jgi:hypothetical protein